MKSTLELSPLVKATLFTGSDVPAPREAPALFIESYETSSEGLGGYGAPDRIEICGPAALQKLSELISKGLTRPAAPDQ